MKPVVRIDDTGCWGCKACEVACKQEHNTPVGIKLIEVIEEKPLIKDHRLTFTYKHKRCLHCKQPHCRKACPEAAISKDEKTGIVLIDSEACTGCGLAPMEMVGALEGEQQGAGGKRLTACMEACPYGAIAFDWRAGKVRKCDLCHFRIVNGLIPACADNVCLAHCIYFGEQENISRMIKEKEWLKYRMEGKLGEMIIRVED